ncbi:MAG TPA: excinuclease ABC subunit UvrA [Terriglobales bacterium]|nr:excinuclease ABC subunit UvrA [Terriglobales bacterium]
MAAESIVVRGARVHNLKNIDFEIPHNTLTVVTGVSGSGKSSLAFDTIYAEGQRRYVESLSAYARQFLERIEKPDADLIDGIAPAIAIRQKNTTRNPRSTVATATEIYDYLRLLFARIGRTYCMECGSEVRRDTVDEVADAVLALGDGARLQALFPLHPRMASPPPAEAAGKPKTRGKRKKATSVAPDSDLLKGRLFELRKRGFNRLYQNGQVFEFSTPESLLDVDFSAPVFVLVDRLSVSADARARVVDAVETGYRESGEVVFETAPDGRPPERLRFAQRFECKRCHLRYEEPEPRLFSFNSPYGACPRCQGFGNTIDFDLDLVIPDKSRSLGEGAIDPWTKPKYRVFFNELKRFARARNLPLDVPWSELHRDDQQLVLDGEGRFPGVRGFFAYLERKKYKLHVRVFLSRYRGYAVCPACHGTRLRVEARQVRIAGKSICDICRMTVEEAARFFRELELGIAEAAVAERVLQEVRERLKFLNDVGLEYLTLDRLASTLSGGEAQRIQLATSLGSRLVGSLYVLDEPSIGLHSRDTSRLVGILQDLRDQGNTILVVEHDAEVMRSADRILDLGPGPGENGGRVVAAGSFDQIVRCGNSLTGKYLAGELHIPTPAQRRKPGTRQIKLFGARAHNLKNLDVAVPLGLMVAVTGVSGSGKSTLVYDVLYQALAAAKGQTNGATGAQGLFDRLEGAHHVQEVVLVDQSPIGRTPRSNPVTYLKAFDPIRELFASLPDSKKRGLGPGHFSFNIPGGRCEACQGDGTVTVEMQFLADVELVCEECKGTRYKTEVLAIRYRGKNIHDVLELTVREAMQFFAGVPRIVERLRVLDEVGLSYLRLGQSATTLSGGEAQRLKLAARLGSSARAGELERGRASSEREGKAPPHVLYMFDEPTTGLHFDDISKLLAAFQRLIKAGGTVLVIEHNLDVIKTADWIIDLGPEGGERGGEIVAVGPPESLARNPQSHTGRWLARILGIGGNGRDHGRR